MKQNVNEYTNTKESRSSNFELFRIIVMLLIIAHHYVVNSGLTSANGPIYANPMSWRSLFLLFVGAWGKIGINCFVLITGYFMCERDISLQKFWKLLIEVIFYKIIIYLAFLAFGYNKFSWSGLANAVIPFKTIKTGFTPCFLMFYLIIPFLNILIHHLTKKQHVKLICICLLIYVLFGTLPFFSVSMNYISWFIVLFFISSFFRLYPHKALDNKKLWGCVTIGLVLIDICSVLLCAWLSIRLKRRIAYNLVTDSNTLLALLTGVSAFLFFKNINIRNNKLINTIASTTFGVFLIHANSDTMRKWLWKTVFDNVGHYNLRLMPLYVLGVVCVVFIVCSLIEYLRILSFNRITDYIVRIKKKNRS